MRRRKRVGGEQKLERPAALARDPVGAGVAGLRSSVSRRRDRRDTDLRWDRRPTSSREDLRSRPSSARSVNRLREPDLSIACGDGEANARIGEDGVREIES